MTLETSHPQTLTAFGLGTLFTLGMGFSSARRELHQAQEVRLKEAVSFLRAHCDELEKLDDEGMPPDLLRLALDVSHLCLDPDASAKFRGLIKSGGYQSLERSQAERRIDDAEFMAFVRARPDLARSFIGAIVTGLIAFEKRWPDCAGVFGQELLNLVLAPLEEAQRVVATARGLKLDWREMIPAGNRPAFH